jgi:hypothetical protein
VAMKGQRLSHMCKWILRRASDCNFLPRDLKRGSAAFRLLGLGVRIPLGKWTFFSCEHCVLSSRVFCLRLLTRPEVSYWVWFVQWVRSRSLLRGGHDPELGRSAKGDWCTFISDSQISGTLQNATTNCLTSSTDWRKLEIFSLSKRNYTSRCKIYSLELKGTFQKLSCKKVTFLTRGQD